MFTLRSPYISSGKELLVATRQFIVPCAYIGNTNMAIEKKRLHLKSALSFLMYFTIIFGIVPYSGIAYFKHNILKLSVFGNVWAMLNVIHNCVEHHLASTRFILSDKQEAGTLTNIIGLVIMYMEPVM